MKANVIDITDRLKIKNKKIQNKTSIGKSAVTDISKMRSEALEEDRRKVKRTILTEFIGTHIVIPGFGLKKVELYDISTDGVSFDLDPKMGEFITGDEVSMRIYLNHGAYFPFSLEISHGRFDENENVNRHGAHFIKGSVNEEALFHFVKFLETVSTSIKKDEGDILVSNIIIK